MELREIHTDVYLCCAALGGLLRHHHLAEFRTARLSLLSGFWLLSTIQQCEGDGRREVDWIDPIMQQGFSSKPTNLWFFGSSLQFRRLLGRLAGRLDNRTTCCTLKLAGCADGNSSHNEHQLKRYKHEQLGRASGTSAAVGVIRLRVCLGQVVVAAASLSLIGTTFLAVESTPP